MLTLPQPRPHPLHSCHGPRAQSGEQRTPHSLEEEGGGLPEHRLGEVGWGGQEGNSRQVTGRVWLPKPQTDSPENGEHGPQGPGSQ